MNQSYFDALLSGISDRAAALTAEQNVPGQGSRHGYYFSPRESQPDLNKMEFTSDTARSEFLRESLLPVASMITSYTTTGIYAGMDRAYEQSLDRQDPEYYRFYRSFMANLVKNAHLMTADDSDPPKEEDLRASHYDLVSLYYHYVLYQDIYPSYNRYGYPSNFLAEGTQTGPHSLYQSDMEYFSRSTLGIPRQKDWIPYQQLEFLLDLHPLNALMLPEDKRFYYYWRSEYRKGHVIPVNPTYVLLYLYELFGNMYKDPHNLLQEVLRVYTDFWNSPLSSIRKTLMVWVLAAIQTFKLRQEEFLPFYALLDNLQEKRLYAPYYMSALSAEDEVEITLDWIDYFSEYSYKNGKLYRSHGAKLEDCLLEAFRFADDYMKKKGGKGLIKTYMPGPVQITLSARYFPIQTLQKGKLKFINLPKVSMIPYQSTSTLKNKFTAIVKETDLILRKHFKIMGRLKNPGMDPEFSKALHSHMQDYLTGKNPGKPRSVNLDYETIVKLRQQSNEVREALRVEDEEPAPLQKQGIPETADKTPAASKTKPSRSSGKPAGSSAKPAGSSGKPAGSSGKPTGSETDADQNLSPEDMQKLAQIKNTFITPMLTLIRQIHQAPQGLNCTARRKRLYAMVNEALEPVVHQPLILYHDGVLTMNDSLWHQIADVFVQNGKPQTSPQIPPASGQQPQSEPAKQPAAQKDSEKTMPSAGSSKSPYASFVQGLTPVQHQALEIISEEKQVSSQLDTLADSAFTMADILVDEINAAFMDEFGDVLIDAFESEPHLEKQYAPEIRRLLHGQ